MWRSLSHDFVLPFVGICQEKHLFLVPPYIKNGTLAQWLEKSKSIDCSGRRTCMLFVILLFVDAHPPRKILEVAKGL